MTYRVLTAMAFALGLAAIVHAQQPKAPDLSGPSDGSASTSRGQAIDPELAEMTAEEIAKRPLLNVQGEEIGYVEYVVRDAQDESLKAVTSVGGFLGLGRRQMVVPLAEIRFEEDRLVTRLADSSGDLKSRTSAFDENRHRRLAGRTRIADVAIATTELAGIRFENVDADGDGYISVPEARRHEALAETWNTLDVNGDGRLDRGEFAAFEDQPGQSPGAQDQTRPREQDQTRRRDSVRDQNKLRQRDQDVPRQRDQVPAPGR